MCSVYKNCCNPYIDLINKSRYEQNNTQIQIQTQTQCIISHEANINPSDILNDPSNSGFCSKLTGYAISSSVSNKTCNFMESRGMINRSSCKDNFCSSGLNGYLSFLLQGVSYLQRNIYPICGIFSFMMSLQMMLLILVIMNYSNIKYKTVKNTLVQTIKVEASNDLDF